MLHPIQALDHVINSYRDHLTTEFRARDPQLQQRLVDALDREGFLAQEAYFSAHQPYQPGKAWQDLPLDDKLAAALQSRAGGNPTYQHQAQAIEHLLGLQAGPVVVSTGTGSGKTESFLAPVLQASINDSLLTKNQPGLVAILLYPMNALANDQEIRIRQYLEQSGWSGSIRVATYNRNTGQKERDEMRNQPPHLLLTNYQMLEYLLVRPADREPLFKNHRLRFIVLDEVHTYGGGLGSHVALLVRRLKAHLRRAEPERLPPVFVGTSATIATGGGDPQSAIQNFFGRLVGVDPSSVTVIGEIKQAVITPPDAQIASAPYAADGLDLDDPQQLRETLANLAGLPVDTPIWESARCCKLLWELARWLGERAYSISDLATLVAERLPERAGWDIDTLRKEVSLALRAGSALSAIPGGAQQPGALRLRAHRFVRGGWEFTRCLNPDCGALYPHGESECPVCGSQAAPLYLCRNCGADFWRMRGPDGGNGHLTPNPDVYKTGKTGQKNDQVEWLLYQSANWKLTGYEEDTPDGEVIREDEDVYIATGEDSVGESGRKGTSRTLKPISGGWDPANLMFTAGQSAPFLSSIYPSRKRCPNCGSMGGSRNIITQVSLGTSAAVKVLTEGLLEALPEGDKKRILIFADSRQDAAHQARFIAFSSRYDRMRSRVVRALKQESPLPLSALIECLGQFGYEFRDNPHLQKSISYGLVVPKAPIDKEKYLAWEEAPLLDDIAVNTRYRAALENLGLLGVDYVDLSKFVETYKNALSAGLGIRPEYFGYVVLQFLDSLRRAGALSRVLLQNHPQSLNKREITEGAQWERRLANPIGFPADTVGHPSLHMDNKQSSLSPGISCRPVWASGSRISSPQQVLVRLAAGLNHSAPSPEGAEALLHALADEQYLVLAELHGRSGKPARLYQVNAGMVLLSLPKENARYRCNTCSKTVYLPTWARFVGDVHCSRCEQGELVSFPNKAVCDSRYAQRAMNPQAVSLKAAEHTAQIPGIKRKEYEDQFKNSEDALNVLACSPTLELGIHVGGLEAVALRNVPPRPDNYAQRGGRAGRDQRVGLVVSYTRNTPHDQYFFQHPEEMIAGAVPAPTFSLGNRDALLRHVHAIAFGLAEPGIASRMNEYVNFKGEVRQDAVDKLLEGINAVSDVAQQIALDAFAADILPAARMEAGDLETTLEMLSGQLQDAFNRTAKQVAQLHTTIENWAEVGGKHWAATRANKLIDQLLGNQSESEDQQADIGSAYPLRRLAECGILPGYEFPVEPATLRLLTDDDEWAPLSTSRSSGLRQFQPGAPVYARGKRWKVTGLDGSSPWNPQGQDPTWHYQRCNSCGLIFDPQVSPSCPRCNWIGSTVVLSAFDYAGFIARPDDTSLSEEEERTYGQNNVEIHPSWTNEAAQPIAGRWKLPDGWQLEWRRGEKVVWLNEGLPAMEEDVVAIFGDEEIRRTGFRMCPECGRVLKKPPKPKKSKSSQKAAQKTSSEDPFGHSERCSKRGQDVNPYALYAEAKIETLRLLFPWPGNPQNPEDLQHLNTWALTLGYALLAGAQRYFALDSADLDVIWEGLRKQEYNGKPYWQGIITFIDPNIGGSGYLEKMAAEFEQVAGSSIHHLEHDNCETACYRCLKTYDNQRFHDQLHWPVVTSTLNGLLDAKPTTAKLSPVDVDDPQPWLDAFEAGCASPLEHRVLMELEEAGYHPDLQFSIKDQENKVFTIADFAFPEKRLAIYVDGLAFHKGDRLRRDKAIEQRLKALSPVWSVIRIQRKNILEKVQEVVNFLNS